MLTVGMAAGTALTEFRLLFAVLAAAAAVIAAISVLRKYSFRMAAILCVILFTSAAYGGLRAVYPSVSATEDKVTITGYVADDPDVQTDKSRTVVRLTNVTADGEKINSDIRLYLYGAGEGTVTMSDQVTVTARLRLPTETGMNGFNYRAYLWSYGIGAYAGVNVEDAEIKPISGGISEMICDIRSAITAKINTLFPKHADIMKALLLGDRSGMSDSDTNAFSAAGILHLLAVSGLHVSALAMLLTKLLTKLRLSRKGQFIPVALLLVLYTILCGGSPSVVRATIMYIYLMIGTLLLRPNDLLTRIGAAAALMLLWSPMLIQRTGFLLSFGAVLGIAIIYPTLAEYTGKISVKPLRALANGMAVSLAAQIPIIPVMLSAFGSVSLTGLVLNILCAPLAEIVLLLGIPATLFGSLIGFLPALCDWLCGILVAIAQKTASLGIGILDLPTLSAVAAAVYMLCLIPASRLYAAAQNRRIAALILLPAIIFANTSAVFLLRSLPQLTVTFVDVGQANCAVVDAEGSMYMIDAATDYGTAGTYLSDNRIQIKALFLTHAHDDHAGGLASVLKACTPEKIYVPVGYDGEKADSESLTAIAEAAAQGIPIYVVQAGDIISLSDNVTAEILAPIEPGNGGNDTSMMIRVSYGASSVLFTGDMTTSAEPESVPASTVLAVAHHGADSSTSSQFLCMADPQLAVISVGANNSYGHPGAATLQRLQESGAEILRTDVYGGITLRLAKNGDVWYKTEER